MQYGKLKQCVRKRQMFSAAVVGRREVLWAPLWGTVMFMAVSSSYVNIGQCVL